LNEASIHLREEGFERLLVVPDRGGRKGDLHHVHLRTAAVFGVEIVDDVEVSNKGIEERVAVRAAGAENREPKRGAVGEEVLMRGEVRQLSNREHEAGEEPGLGLVAIVRVIVEGLRKGEGGRGEQAGVVENVVQKGAKAGGNQSIGRVAGFHRSERKMRRPV
jgi:hypothetical protein